MKLAVVLGIAALALLARSDEETPCICTEELAPVCGSDGKTYDNKCLLECAQKKNKDLVMLAEKACPPICLCPKIYAPVCGSDGVTYDNTCILECERTDGKDISVVDFQECKPCKCNKIYSPVCGTDGVTYNNRCLLKCVQQMERGKNLKIASDGRCGVFVFPED